MRFNVLFASMLFATLSLASVSARADVPPADSCTTAGSSCDTAAPDYKSPGTCTDTTCTKLNPADGGTYEYPCLRCMPNSGTAGAGGGTGTGGSAGSSSKSSGSSDDGGCSLSPGGPGSNAPWLALGLLGLGLGVGFRRRAARA
jgi:MYXO-CTERM domain-containing protein